MRRIVVSLLAVAGMGGLVPANASALPLLNETFRDPTTANADFLVGGRVTPACLTASQDLNQTPIPGCSIGSPSVPTGGDPPGSGALRLTNNRQNQTGYVLYQDPQPITAGLEIKFLLYAYNASTSQQADGITFFLNRGDTPLTRPGAFGGSLGYAQRSEEPGLPGALFGLGFDEFGNFTNDNEGRGKGCANKAPSTGLQPDHIGLRGRAGPDSTTLYCLLADINVSNRGSLDVPGATNRDTPGVERRVEIRVDPASQANGRLRASIDYEDGQGLVEVVNVPLPADLRGSVSTFKFGFAGATGSGTNIHEIRGLDVQSILPLPRLAIAKEAGGPYDAGGEGSFVLTPRTESGENVGPVASPVTVTDPIPFGTVRGVPSGAGWDCSATPVGSAAVSCTRPASGTSPIPAGTALPPITVPIAFPPDRSGIFENRTEIDSIDNANTPEQSSGRDNYAVRPRGADDFGVTSVGRPALVPLLANDTGSLDPRTLTFPTKPADGTAQWDASGERLTYLPDPGFSGFDRFTYRVFDTSGQAVTQNVTIQVTPEASDDRATTLYETPVVIDPLANDRGTLQPASLAIVSGPANGTVAVNPANGYVTYTPNAGFTGQDSFVYDVFDRDGQRVRATVIVDVGPPPPAPPPTPSPPPSPPPPPSQLVVTKQVDRPQVQAGGLLTYRVVVENRGEGPALDVVLVDTPILRVDVVRYSASQGSCVRPGPGVPDVCSFGTIPPGGRVTIEVVVRTREPGLLRNGVGVTAATPDANTSDNSASAVARVVRYTSRVTIEKTASRSVVRPGQSVLFDIRVQSRGPEAARDLRVCDRLPTGLVSVRAPEGRLRDGRICWDAGDVPSGESREYQVLARATNANASRRLVNTATVAGANLRARRATAAVRLRAERSGRAGGVTG